MHPVFLAAALCAAGSSASLAAPFFWTFDGPAVVQPGQEVFIAVSAAHVGGIGAVSGFNDLIVQVIDPTDEAWVRFDLLTHFDGLGQGNGSEGAMLSGLSGGQVAFPPQMPISFSLDLFRLELLGVSQTPREIQITVSGRGGYFLTTNGQSLVPFEEVPLASFAVQVVPSPSGVAVMTLAALFSHRRRVGGPGADIP